MTISKQLILAAGFGVFAGSAQAALRICNETDFVQSVSLGYEADAGWTSKGWWNIEPSDCAVVVGGDLPKRYYYIRAEVDGGDFAGEGYMFCTTPKEYEIVGDTDCENRGYDSESFREIDTGETATDFTYTLTGGTTTPPPRNDDTPGPDNTAELGLTICNQTSDVQSISIGYERGSDFVSEGWWNIDPEECSKVLGGKLEQRYYYYRAEVRAGPFEGEGYMFCTSPQVYEIVGDTDCEARGYDTESFSEIDTGPAAQGFTFYVTANSNSTPPPSNDPPPVVNTAGSGFEICNSTDYKQSVTIGFEGAEDWTSMGWWNLDPGECTKPRLDGVNHRYLYYRAESAGGEFVGEYFFCTMLEPFEIAGDGNCEARGYERKSYREIDTGGTTEPFTLTLLESELFDTPAITPEDDRPTTFPPVDDSVETDSDTPVFDFPPVVDGPETPEPDVTTRVDPDFGPTTDTPEVVDTPVEETPFVEDTPVQDPPPVVEDTTVVDDTPDVFEPPAVDEEEDDSPKPPRRGGSRGG